jgi:hypothetical protein
LSDWSALRDTTINWGFITRIFSTVEVQSAILFVAASLIQSLQFCRLQAGLFT